MRLYSFEVDGREVVGVQIGERLLCITDAQQFMVEHEQLAPWIADGLTVYADMLALVRDGRAAIDAVRNVLAFASEHPDVIEAENFLHWMDTVRVLVPLRPSKILCSGLNYRSHLNENPGAKFLEDPRFFAKLPSTVIGPFEPILHPGEKFQVDYEVELAVVIGRTARHLTQANAMEHVFGYTILHDVSARWIQFKDNNETMGKNFDTFCPLGPCIVTADEIPDPGKLRLSLKLNGQTMQNGTNEDWIFPLPRMLEWLTMAMTLEPGDIVSTGTPAGIGYFRRPQVFLKPGDVCQLEIEKIGVLENTVVSAEED